MSPVEALRAVATAAACADFSSTPAAASIGEFVCRYYESYMEARAPSCPALLAAGLRAREVLPGVVCISGESQVRQPNPTKVRTELCRF